MKPDAPGSRPAVSGFPRRRFLGACCAGVGATGLVSTLAQLRVLGAVAGASLPAAPKSAPPRAGAIAPDFKALVCLFLAGGNDANNVIVPAEAESHRPYARARGPLALPRDALLSLGARSGDGRAWGLHPAMTELRDLFDRGSLAVLANVGTLAFPTTRRQYESRSVPLPRQLFSHNDQQVAWQSGVADAGSASGWGGRLADLTQAFNENNRISMSISLNGTNAFQVGRTVAQYAVTPGGAVPLQSGGASAAANAARLAALNDGFAATHGNLLEAAFAGLTAESLASGALLSSILDGEDPVSSLPFPPSHLGQQLKMIARLVGVQGKLGLRRQIFFARVGGWDLHDSQVAAGGASLGAHAALLTDLSRSLAAFQEAVERLGAAERVTTFTASDFGRTLTTNGDGSDHAWGSHHFILGGAVNGRKIYGRMPDLTLDGPDDVGRGTWVPTTSVDEYAATLARWFGVSARDLPVVLPNIGRFASQDLGFLRA